MVKFLRVTVTPSGVTPYAALLNLDNVKYVRESGSVAGALAVRLIDDTDMLVVGTLADLEKFLTVVGYEIGGFEF